MTFLLFMLLLYMTHGTNTNKELHDVSPFWGPVIDSICKLSKVMIGAHRNQMMTAPHAALAIVSSIRVERGAC